LNAIAHNEIMADDELKVWKRCDDYL